MYTDASTAADGARLEDYLRAIKERKWVVLATALILVLLANTYLRTRTNQYAAEATVLLAPTPVGSINANLINPNLEKEREVILSNQTASDVVENLGLADEPRALLEFVDVTFRPDSDVLNIEYTNTDPEIAAAYANGFASAYVERREGEALRFYEAQITEAEGNITDLGSQVAELQDQISSLEDEQSRLVANFPDQDERSLELARLTNDLALLRSSRGSLSNQANNEAARLRTIESSLVSRTPSAAFLRTAAPPGAPAGLASSFVYASAGLLGLIFGIVTAFTLERLDTTARSESDVALALGTTVVGSVPSLPLGSRNGASALVMLTTGGRARLSAAREAFRRLRSSVQFMGSANEVKIILLTSASPGEGKSVVAGNLAIALAQAGSSVALVSGDLRRPSQENRFGLPSEGPGLSEYLGGSGDIAVDEIEGVRSLWFIRAGSMPANPGELLGSERMGELLADLGRQLDFVIVDSPPVLSTADALAVSRYVDGVLVVVDSRRTNHSDLLQVRADLERSGSKLLGSVLNKTRFRRAGLFRRDRYAYYAASSDRSLSRVTSDDAQGSDDAEQPQLATK